MTFFNEDRLYKYGLGLFRLFVVVLIAFSYRSLNNLSSFFDVSILSKEFLIYLSSHRSIGHAYIGTIGAFVNVHKDKFFLNLTLLLGAALVCIYDVKYDYSILIYLVKTVSGDYLAGKLDTIEWKLVLIFTFFIFGPVVFFLENNNLYYVLSYLRILFYMF